ncbi:MAG: heavy-metal-associated domain-containing protein [Bacteroidota bacterium]
MTKQYRVAGMTCGGCVNSVNDRLSKVVGGAALVVQLEGPQVKIATPTEPSLAAMQAALGSRYTIQEWPETAPAAPATTVSLPTPSLQTYRPLLLLVSFIIGTTLLAQYPFSDFSVTKWMRHFMAGFFIVFSFFKLLNLDGFAEAYRQYDLLAARWRGWGYVYPFVELGLGILYLTNLAPAFTNWTTVLVLGFSSLGVIKSNLEKRQIRCACLGDVFNLPMSTVTIVEDVTMVLMAAWMLL